MFLFVILAIFSTAVSSANVTTTYFDMVVNMTMYNHTNTSLFVDTLADVIHVVNADTIVMVDSTNVSLENASLLETMCVTLLPNSTSTIGNDSSWTFLWLNISFVGNESEASASSRALESISYLSACSIGILNMNATNVSSTSSTVPITFLVTLATGVTPQMFVNNLATLMKVPTSIFVISVNSNSTTNVSSSTTSSEWSAIMHRSFTQTSGETFNLTIIGANTAVIQSRVLNLSTAQLLSLGATDLTLAVITPPQNTTTPAPQNNDGGDNDDDDHTELIIILCCSIGGGLLIIIVTVVVCIRCRRPAHEQLKESVETNHLVRPEDQSATMQEMYQQDLTRGHDSAFGNPYTPSNTKPETPIRMARPPRIAIQNANVNLL